MKDGWTDIARRIRDRIAGAAAARSSTPESGCSRPSRTATSRRWRRSAPGSTRSSRTRRPPRSSRRGTASCASGRASTTSTCRRTTSRARTSSTPTARASSASPRPGWSPPAGEYEVDCIIYASGFEVGTDLRRAGPASTLTGRDGVRLSEHWADGMRTLHGIHVHGFPNVFLVQLAQGAQPDLQRPAQPHRVGPDHRRRRRARPRPRPPRGRGHRAGRGGVGRAAQVGSGQHPRLAGLHARLLQQRGPRARTGDPAPGRAPARRHGLLRLPRPLARVRHVRGPGVPGIGPTTPPARSRAWSSGIGRPPPREVSWTSAPAARRPRRESPGR